MRSHCTPFYEKKKALQMKFFVDTANVDEIKRVNPVRAR